MGGEETPRGKAFPSASRVRSAQSVCAHPFTLPMLQALERLVDILTPARNGSGNAFKKRCHKTYLYPTAVALTPLRPPRLLRFRLCTLLANTAATSFKVAFSSFRAGPHQGLRRKAARIALELFPGMTTYWINV